MSTLHERLQRRVYIALFGAGDASGLTLTQLISVIIFLTSVMPALLDIEPVVVRGLNVDLPTSPQ